MKGWKANKTIILSYFLSTIHRPHKVRPGCQRPTQKNAKSLIEKWYRVQGRKSQGMGEVPRTDLLPTDFCKCRFMTFHICFPSIVPLEIASRRIILIPHMIGSQILLKCSILFMLSAGTHFSFLWFYLAWVLISLQVWLHPLLWYPPAKCYFLKIQQLFFSSSVCVL